MNKYKNILIIFVLFIITVVYYLPIINLPLAPYDEAVILVGAEKVLNGQIPHRDFSSEYPPGQLYTLAALFKMFGISVITERVYDLLIKSLLSLFVFIIIRFLSTNKTALLGWLMSLIWLQHSSFPAYPVYPSILFIYISIYLLLHYMKKQKNYYVVLSAISIVLSILFRHDIGGYAAAAVITILLIFIRIRGIESWSPLVSFILSAAITGLLLTTYFILNSAIGLIFNDLALIPMAFSEHQALPYPPLTRWNLPFFIFPLVLVTGAISSIIQIVRKVDDSKSYAILLISLTGIFFFNQLRWRSDIIHLLPVAITGILLAPILLYTLSRRLSLSVWQNRVICLLFIIVFGITLSKPTSDIKRLLSSTNGYVVNVITPDIEKAGYSMIDSDLKDVVAYIKKNTLKNERIYVGVKNHDRFVFNDVIIYFLAERNSATRYHTLNPGVHTTLKVQKEVIDEFRNTPPRLVVLAPRSRYEPNLSNVDSQIDILDNYISTHYALKKTFGIYEIWMKKL